MKHYKSLVFFVALTSCNLFAETYLNSNEVKDLLSKIEKASAVNGQNQDLTQKELAEIQKKVNLSNQKRNLETSENAIGLNEENLNKRIDSLQNFYSSTISMEEYIYNDNFSYQSICKDNTKCKASALVESEIFNQKLHTINQKIMSDKAETIDSLKAISPINDKINIVKQIEQTTYSINNASMGTNYNNNLNTNSRKRTSIEVSDGDIIGNVKITITPNYVKLSKR